jgi:hypothetical protein
MNINLHIERLVLDGVPLAPSGRPRLRAAVEGELSRLLTEGGLSAGVQSGGAMPTVRAIPMLIDGDAHPSRMGQAIARSVYGGLGK